MRGSEIIVATAASGYWHRQGGPLCLIYYGSASACMVVGLTQGRISACAVGLMLALIGLMFHHLTVVDQGDSLAIRFGPIPLFRRSIRYADIERVEVGRTLILDGWGIHFSIRGGWVWNVWGRDCVVIHQRGGVLRVGTDNAPNLTAFLQGKIAQSRE